MAIIKDAQGNDVEVLTAEELGDKINSTVSDHLRRAMPKLTGELAKQVTADVTKAVDESTAELLNQWEEKQKEAQKQPGTGSPQPPALPEQKLEESPAFKVMQKKQEELQSALEKAQSERDAERARARENSLRTATLDTLAELGLSDQNRARLASGHLIDASKRVVWDEHDPDALLFKDTKGDLLPLRDGLADWLKTDEAKIFLPPRGAGGSGGTAGTSGPRVTSGDTIKQQAAEQLAQHLFPGGVIGL